MTTMEGVTLGRVEEIKYKYPGIRPLGPLAKIR